jgi:hypothetical protein
MVVGVFVRFRAPLQNNTLKISKTRFKINNTIKINKHVQNKQHSQNKQTRSK